MCCPAFFAISQKIFEMSELDVYKRQIPITPDNQEEILKTFPVDWTYETLVEQDAMVILGTSVQKDLRFARWLCLGAEHPCGIRAGQQF